MERGQSTWQNGAFTVNNSLTSTEGGLTVSNQAGTTVSAGTNVDVDNVSVSANATLNVAGTGTANNQITRITANELTVDSYATLHLGTIASWNRLLQLRF